MANLSCGIDSSIATPANSLHLILAAYPANAADIFRALSGCTVFIVDKVFGGFLSYTAGVSIVMLSPTNNTANQKWILTGGSAPVVKDAGDQMNTSSAGWKIACAGDPQAALMLYEKNAWIRYGGTMELNRGNWTLVAGKCGMLLTIQNSTDAPAYLVGPANNLDPLRRMTIGGATPITEGVRASRGQLWQIILENPAEFCAKLPQTYGFNLAPCRSLLPSPLLDTLAKNYCVGRDPATNKSRLMTDKDCRKWCVANPALCEPVMLNYCSDNPAAAECGCIYATRQPDYISFTKLNPTIGGPAYCFTDVCKQTSLTSALIPQSIQKMLLGCPDITSQKTQQTVNVGQGAIVTGLSISSSQTASSADQSSSSGDSTSQTVGGAGGTDATGGSGTTQTITKAPITANIALPSYLPLIILIIFSAIFFIWIIMGDDEPVSPSAEATEIAAEPQGESAGWTW